MGRISFKRVQELMDYSPSTGVLTWKSTRGSRAIAGDVAGSFDKHGYIQVGLDGRDYKGHRLAWLLHYGNWPNGEIDHINGNPRDNRIANLREATRSENTKNVAMHRDNSSGFKGVSLHRETGKWDASIFSDGKKYFLGLYDTPQQAHAAYCGASRVLHKEFARVA